MLLKLFLALLFNLQLLDLKFLLFVLPLELHLLVTAFQLLFEFSLDDLFELLQLLLALSFQSSLFFHDCFLLLALEFF